MLNNSSGYKSFISAFCIILCNNFLLVRPELFDGSKRVECFTLKAIQVVSKRPRNEYTYNRITCSNQTKGTAMKTFSIYFLLHGEVVGKPITCCTSLDTFSDLCPTDFDRKPVNDVQISGGKKTYSKTCISQPDVTGLMPWPRWSRANPLLR